MDPVIANAVESFLNFSPNTEDPPKTLEVLGAMSLSFVLNMLIGALYKHTYKGTPLLAGLRSYHRHHRNGHHHPHYGC